MNHMLPNHSLVYDPALPTYRKSKHGYRDFSFFQEAEFGASSLKSTSTFPMKLHYLLQEVEKERSATIITWIEHGRSFMVVDQIRFVKEILPYWFQMNHYSSFQRQLNMYGFNRITSGKDKGSYYHMFFLRGKRFLTRYIERVKVKGTGSRKPASPETEPNFYTLPMLPEHGMDCKIGPPSPMTFKLPVIEDRVNVLSQNSKKDGQDQDYDLTVNRVTQCSYHDDSKGSLEVYSNTFLNARESSPLLDGKQIPISSIFPGEVTSHRLPSPVQDQSHKTKQRKDQPLPVVPASQCLENSFAAPPARLKHVSATSSALEAEHLFEATLHSRRQRGPPYLCDSAQHLDHSLWRANRADMRCHVPQDYRKPFLSMNRNVETMGSLHNLTATVYSAGTHQLRSFPDLTGSTERSDQGKIEMESEYISRLGDTALGTRKLLSEDFLRAWVRLPSADLVLQESERLYAKNVSGEDKERTKINFYIDSRRRVCSDSMTDPSTATTRLTNDSRGIKSVAALLTNGALVRGNQSPEVPCDQHLGRVGLCPLLNPALMITDDHDSGLIRAKSDVFQPDLGWNGGSDAPGFEAILAAGKILFESDLLHK